MLIRAGGALEMVTGSLMALGDASRDDWHRSSIAAVAAASACSRCSTLAASSFTALINTYVSAEGSKTRISSSPGSFGNAATRWIVSGTIVSISWPSTPTPARPAGVPARPL